MRAREVIGGLLLLAGLTVYTVNSPNRWNLLWACHVFSALLALSSLAGWRRGMAMGFLFELMVGSWLYFVDGMINHDLPPISSVIHVLPVVVGAVLLWRTPLPRASWLAVTAVCLVLLPLTRWLTPPELNVNVAFTTWNVVGPLPWPLAALGTLALVAGLCAAGQAGWNRLAREPA